MAKFRITDPTGKAYEVTAPEGATQDQVLAFAQQQFSASQQPEIKQDAGMNDRGGLLQNMAGGLLRGAGSIGATILSPVDAAARALNQGKPINIGGYDIAGQDRRQAMTDALRTAGVNPDSLGFKAGKIGAEVAGTMGAGGALAKGMSAIPGVAQYAPALVDAIGTSGMSAGSATGMPALAARVAGGAISGGAQAGMANPEDAKTGALIGGALPVAGEVVKGLGALAKKAVGGTTGVGEEAFNQAFKAGQTGGQTAEDFTSAMRGKSSMDDVLSMAKQNLAEMGAQKQAAYRQGMAGVKSDKTVLDLKNVDQAVNDAIGMATYKGQVKNERAAQALANIKGEVDNWKSLDPAEFHTPEGLDALKQKIGGILEDIPFEQKTARTAAGKVYDSIKTEISNQAPEYSKVMKGYSEASDTIKEIERALSLGQKAAADTSMRKLQSLMRNNVSTNYGQRAQLADLLQQSGGQDFMPALAGQALTSAIPRGIQGAGVGTGGAGLALTGNIPAAAGLAAVSSPRLMGETFYGAGKASRALDPRLIQLLMRGAPIAGTQQNNQ